MSSHRLNFLCISTYFKGEDFLKSCKAEGHKVYLLTLKKLEHEKWPWDVIDDVYYIDEWNLENVVKGIAYQFRTINFDRFVALDDFDVEKTGLLREHFRMPGMGSSTSLYFRDKLAMRIKAQSENIQVPLFTSLFNNDKINEFIEGTSAPWLLKPRMEASATGIKKLWNKQDIWETINSIGNERDNYLLEIFAPGDVYHVDSLIVGGKVVFGTASRYLDTPFEVAHSGGIFRSMTCEQNSKVEKALLKMNHAVMRAFGIQYGASHTEFIQNKETGALYFLETSSRVGGANIAEMVEFGRGVNLWSEWAKIESAVLQNKKYTLPKLKNLYSGIVVSLSRFQYPDTSTFDDPEIVWRMQKDWHIGMIVVAKTREKVEALLNQYTQRIAQEYHASLPAPDKSE